MTAMWMAYAFLVALLLGVGAHGTERALRLAGRAGRWPWAAALLGSWLVPLAALARRTPPGSDGFLQATGAATGSPAATTTAGPGLLRALTAALALPGRAGEAVGALLGRLPAEALAAGHPDWLVAAGRWGPVLWMVTSALALAFAVLAAGTLLRRTRRWPERWVLGEPVRLSPDFGPALVGVVRPRIVLPRWVLGLGRASLGLILEHEREHRRSRDTLMLTLGGLAALAAPWNVPLWWQLRRLRLAVELDCDRRVLRRGVAPREYGALLVEIGERVGRIGLPAAALAERSSFLERRLRMMTERRSRWTGWRAGGAAALALGTVAVACETPAPTEVQATAPTGDVAGVVEKAPDAGRHHFEAVAIPANALVVIDGVVAPGKTVADIQALAVERIEVVRGGTEAYGMRGRDGVVHVTTKAAASAVGGARGSAVFRLEERPSGRRGMEPTADPLVVIDGVVTARELADLDGLDVVRVEVVKGGAARALYGERGADGVVRITTGAEESGPSRLRRLEEAPAGGRVPGPEERTGAGGATIETVEVAPIVFVDGEQWTRPMDAITDLDVADVQVLTDGAADRFLEGTGIDRDGRSVIRVTTRR